jgi:hypothetical protein
MDNLLFTALTLATLYYFFYYLPEQKKLEPKFSQSISTQTETLPNPDDQLLESSIDELIKQIKQLNHQLK